MTSGKVTHFELISTYKSRHSKKLPEPKSTVLDFGSGDGSVAKYLIENTGCRIIAATFQIGRLNF